VSDMTTPPPEGAEPPAAEPAPEAPMTDAAPPVPAPPSVPAATRAGESGPPGKIRSWVAVAVLTIITCGIYGLFWQ
jgi:hypothetical protein